MVNVSTFSTNAIWALGMWTLIGFAKFLILDSEIWGPHMWSMVSLFITQSSLKVECEMKQYDNVLVTLGGFVIVLRLEKLGIIYLILVKCRVLDSWFLIIVSSYQHHELLIGESKILWCWCLGSLGASDRMIGPSISIFMFILSLIFLVIYLVLILFFPLWHWALE